MNYDLDLDLLKGETKKIKLGGDMLEASSPSLDSLVSILKAAQRMTEASEGDNSTEAQIEALDTLMEELERSIPGLKSKGANFKQLQAIVEMLIQMATPDDFQELKKRGISLETKELKKNLG